MIEILLASAAGALTVAAPCVLPMLPIIVGTSIGQTSWARPIFIALGFALAFSSAALVFGAFSDALGFSDDTLRSVAALLLMAFGVLMVWPGPFARLAEMLDSVVNRVGAIGRRAGPDNLGGLVLGVTLGILWTPCAGPMLGAILTLVATAKHLGHAAILLVCYAIGAATPMLAIAYGGQYVSAHVRRFARHTGRLQQGFGVLVALISIAIYFQYDTAVTVWLAKFYPTLPRL